MQKSRFIRQNIFPTIAAFIWGTAFVAQSMGAEHVGPFTYNTGRSVIGGALVLAIALWFRRLRRRDFAGQARPAPRARRDLLLGGVCCGTAMTLGSYLQQLGLETTSAGKSGFITALYIVLVPLMGLLVHKKARPTVWAAVALAVGGLYFLCIQTGEGTMVRGDFYTLLCSFCFAGHILIVDHFTQRVDGVELACAQLWVTALLSAAGMLAFETPTLEGVRLALGSILYVGVLSSGLAFTLQILAQKDANPTVVALLMSLESFFAVAAGAVVLHDRMSGREYFGCALMLLAVVLAQLPARKRPAAAADAGAGTGESGT